MSAVETTPDTLGERTPRREETRWQGSVMAEERDRQLAALFARLGPGRLDALDGVWALCSVDLYGLALWRTGSAHDAEDALQEVFVRLVRLAEDGRLEGVRKPFAYLLRMTHSAAIDTLRQRKRHRSSPLDEAPELLDAGLDAGLDRAADARRLSRQLTLLPEGQRAVVYLKHFVELSFREIASVMGIPIFTAASRYRLALRRLRQNLGVEP